MNVKFSHTTIVICEQHILTIIKLPFQVGTSIVSFETKCTVWARSPLIWLIFIFPQICALFGSTRVVGGAELNQKLCFSLNCQVVIAKLRTSINVPIRTKHYCNAVYVDSWYTSCASLRCPLMEVTGRSYFFVRNQIVAALKTYKVRKFFVHFEYLLLNKYLAVLIVDISRPLPTNNLSNWEILVKL